MDNNQSGLNPEKMTFGIEVELMIATGFKSTSIPENVRPSEHILHDMAQRLIDAGLKAEVWTLHGRPSYRSQRPSYRKWVVTDDASIRYDKDKIAGLFPRDRAPAPWQLEQLSHGGVKIVPRFSAAILESADFPSVQNAGGKLPHSIQSIDWITFDMISQCTKIKDLQKLNSDNMPELEMSKLYRSGYCSALRWLGAPQELRAKEWHADRSWGI
ncbi:hypothetical protein RUND412_000626 [Rhizina undulata]